jgi:hypothetical protein
VGDRRAATGVRADNSGNWYGVYVTLDRDYQSGSSFEFTFKVRLQYLMKNGQINYTPGWYDSAVTGKLTIRALVPPNAGEMTYNPTPTATDSSKIVWEKLNLNPGARMTIQVTFKGLESATYVPLVPPSDGGLSDTPLDALVIPVIIVIFGAVLTFFAIRQRKSQATLTDTPTKRKVVTLDKEGKVVKEEEEEEYTKPSVRPVTTSRSSCYVRSCACVSCACVSCACACACAGGRGAGCAKKGFIDCDKCGRKGECRERKVHPKLLN